MRKLYEFFNVLRFQKKMVATATSQGNTGDFPFSGFYKMQIFMFNQA